MAVKVSGETLSDPYKVLEAQFVASSFVKQYYRILERSPEIVYKFYTDQSVIDRPGPDGEMTSVKAMQGINETIMSSDYKGCVAEILNAVAQESLNGGVLISVIGYFIGNDSMRRFFYQTFFLGTQERGFFVLNDILRFLAAHDTLTPAASSETEKITLTVSSTDTHTGTVDSHVHLEPTNEGVMEDDNTHVYPEPTNERVVDDDSKKLADVKDSHSSDAPIQNDDSKKLPDGDSKKLPDVKDSPDAPIQNEVTTAKTSYASMVTKPATIASPARSPASTPMRVSSTADQQPKVPPLLKTPPVDDALKSVYVGNLPPNITKSDLEEAVKVFGRVKQDCIQLKAFEDGFCYGFVEFESASSAQKAVLARNISIGEHEPYITYKRSNTTRSYYNSNGGYRGGPESGGDGASRRPSYRNQSEFEPRDDFYRPRSGGRGRGAESYGWAWNYSRRVDERRLKDGEVAYQQKRDERTMDDEEGGYQRYYHRKVFAR